MPTDRSSPLDAPNVTYLWAQVLVEELVRSGVETFFVAPGSRSTPLTTAVARHPKATSVLHVDERGTAFAALGLGRATRQPAGWITTSGTAVANGLPAVVEASVDAVPMLLLTADRPPELWDTSANQTIDQEKIYGDYVRWHANVPPPTDDIDPAYVLTTVDQAVHRAVRAPAGPVHLNCAFRKPLEPVETETTIAVPPAVRGWAETDEPYTQYPTPVHQSPSNAFDTLAEDVQAYERGLIAVGRLDTAAEADAVRRLVGRLGWPLLPDLTSRLRLGTEENVTRIAFGDLILTSEAFREAHGPDAVLQVGGRFTSKRLRQFFRDSRPTLRAVVRPDPTRVDPDHRATHHIEADVVSFVQALLSRLDASPGTSAWRADWATADARAARIVRRHTTDSERLTEPLVAAVLSRHIPPDHALMAANSMPARDLNRHASTTGASVPAYANRGASGIDGTVATAAGIARGRKGPVTLLTGDLALWHDLNSLALLREHPVVVVVVNNDGGGIFHFLPIREHEDVFEPHFTTPQGRTFEQAAATFDLPYEQPDTSEGLVEAYVQACEAGTAAVIEASTERARNRRIHEELEEDVAAAVEGEET